MARAFARASVCAAVGMMLLGGAVTASAAPVVSVLPTPPANYAWASDVSAAGAVGTYGDVGASGHAVHWAPDGTATTLPLPPGATTGGADGINRHGVVIGHANGQLVRWAPDRTVTVLRLPGNRPYGRTVAVNDRGEIAGEAHRGQEGSWVAVRWSPGGVPTVLPKLAGSLESHVEDIARDGTVVGDAVLTDTRRAVAWSPDGTATALGELPGGVYSSAHGVNARDVVVGTSSDAAGERWPVRWNPDGSITRLTVPAGASQATPEDVNDRGVVVGWAVINGITTPLRWNLNGSVTVLAGSPDWSEAKATAISPNGVIVGADYDFHFPSYRALRWSRP